MSVSKESIQKEVKERSNLLTFSSAAPSNTLRTRSNQGLDLSSLNRILEFGEDWVRVEPRVTFGSLSKACLKRGLIPPVVPEFATITVGGAIMGAALESSSHRFGQVSDCCLEYEVILGNGELVRASPEENRDLFYGLSGSYGTLGILVEIKLQLIKAKPYVSLNAHFLRKEALFTFLTTPQEIDYIEGIALDKESGVALTGQMSAKPSSPLLRLNQSWSPWYIHSIQDLKSQKFSMKIEEYLFRYDRGAFWMGHYVLSFPTMLQILFRLGIPKLNLKKGRPGLLFRLLFGRALTSRRLYRIWHNVPKSVSETLFFVHDFYAPFPKALEAFDHFADLTQIFPVWLCPVKGTSSPQLFSPHYGKENYLNLGFYGMQKSGHTTPQLSAQLEKEITLFEGRKMLYSYTYYDKESFAHIYDETRYKALRKKYFAEEAFPTIYNKLIIC